MSELEVPDGKVLADGHIYKVYFTPGTTQSDEALAMALEALGVVKIQHITDGGTNVVVTPNINTKENA